jgi:hypothetical protein
MGTDKPTNDSNACLVILQRWSDDGAIESFEAGEGANFPPGKLSDGKRSYDSDSPALSDENSSEEVEHNFKLNTEKGYSVAGSHSSEEVTKPKAKGITKALDVMSKFKSLSSPGWRASSGKINSERNRSVIVGYLFTPNIGTCYSLQVPVQ